MLKTDNVYADISGNLGSSLTFTSDYGTLPPPTAVPDNDSLNLSLTGKADGDIENITATYTDQYGETVTVGKLRVKSYEPVDKELIIVPINENTLEISNINDIQTYINNVYKQAAVNWTVTLHDGMTGVEFNENDDPRLDDETTVFTAYTKEMRNIIDSYEELNNTTDKTYVLFLMHSSEKGKAGFMPLKKHYGFIFMDEFRSSKPAELHRTVSHEVAHGAFVLYHTFSEFPALQQGTTDNLMDYTTGTRLCKYQWDLIHDPVWLIVGGGSEEEGAAFGNDYFIKIISVNDDFVPNEIDLVVKFFIRTSDKVSLDDVNADISFHANDPIIPKSIVFDLNKQNSSWDEKNKCFTFKWNGDWDNNNFATPEDGEITIILSFDVEKEEVKTCGGNYATTYSYTAYYPSGFDEADQITYYEITEYKPETDGYIAVSTKAIIDETRMEWEKFRFRDKFGEAGLNEFRRKREQYKYSIKNLGCDENEPLNYLNAYLTDKTMFYGKTFGPTHIMFAYTLKLFELKHPGLISDLTYSSGLRISAFSIETSNHSIGFALDIDAYKNPAIGNYSGNTFYVYGIIKIFTGIDIYNELPFSSIFDASEKFNKVLLDRFDVNINHKHNTDKDASEEEILNANNENNIKLLIAIMSDAFKQRHNYKQNVSNFKLSTQLPITIKETFLQYLNECKRIIEGYNENKYNDLVLSINLLKNKIDNLDDLTQYFENGLLIDLHVSENELNDYKEFISTTITIAKSLSDLAEKLQTIEDFQNEYNSISTQIEELNGYDKSVENCIKIVSEFEEFITQLNGVTDFNDFSEKILSMNIPNHIGGRGIFYKGFLSIPKDVVSKFLNFSIPDDCAFKDLRGKKPFVWGGLYLNQGRDLHHFEIRQSKQYTATTSQIDIGISVKNYTINELINFYNQLSETKYTIGTSIDGSQYPELK